MQAKNSVAVLHGSLVVRGRVLTCKVLSSFQVSRSAEPVSRERAELFGRGVHVYTYGRQGQGRGDQHKNGEGISHLE